MPQQPQKNSTLRKRVVAASNDKGNNKSRNRSRSSKSTVESEGLPLNRKDSNSNTSMAMSSRPNRSSASASASASASSSASAAAAATKKTGPPKQQQQRRRTNLLLWTTAILAPLLYWLVTRSNKNNNSNSNNNNNSNIPATATHNSSKRHKHKARNKARNKYKNKNTSGSIIIEEYRTLVSLSVSPAALRNNNDNDNNDNNNNNNNNNRYGPVRATFCDIDWDLQTANPSTVPMFRDLQAQSSRCEQTTATVEDLYELVRAAREHDSNGNGNDEIGNAESDNSDNHNDNHNHNHNHNDNDNDGTIPAGVVFHETRCGSTLVANLLAGSAPEGRSRVYSESPPPIAALNACNNLDEARCDPDKHAALIRDVFYMMGRRQRRTPTNNNNNNNNNKKDHPHRTFYKIQSIGVMAIDKFTMAFPNVPWIFVFRDTVEILQSHLKQQLPKNTKSTQKARANAEAETETEAVAVAVAPKVCTRNYRLPDARQPPTTLRAITEAGAASPRELDQVQYCAAHLAGLSLAALNEHDRQQQQQQQQQQNENENGASATKTKTTTATTTTTGRRRGGGGRFVEYTQLPERLWEEILPHHFGVGPLTDQDIASLQSVSGVYSKGRGPKANQEWAEDSTRKQQTAPVEVTDAANRFAGTIYQRMRELSSVSSS